jgi:hypothetical protein
VEIECSVTKYLDDPMLLEVSIAPHGTWVLKELCEVDGLSPFVLDPSIRAMIRLVKYCAPNTIEARDLGIGGSRAG